MSKFADDLVCKIKEKRGFFKKIQSGIEGEGIKIVKHGNGALLSLIDVEINDEYIPTTYSDRLKLERAVTWWIRTVSLSYLQHNTI